VDGWGFSGVRYTIEPATDAHMNNMAPRMRAKDVAEVAAVGLSPHRALRASMRRAVWAKAAVAEDGNVIAMWGLGGALMGLQGIPWLLTTALVERVPLEFMRRAKAELGLMLEMYPVLVNHVDANYREATGFLRLLGFTIGEPEPFGRKGALFRRLEIRRG